MHPITHLRSFLSNNPELKRFSSQRGFGQLLGRSDAFVRTLERPGIPVPVKTAKNLEMLTGVQSEWLFKPVVTETEIPAAAGGRLTHSAVIKRIRMKTAEYINETVAILSPGDDFIESLLNLYRKKLRRDLASGDTDLLDKLTSMIGPDGVLNGDGEAD